MVRVSRLVEIDKKEINALTEVIKQLQEDMIGINNKVSAMNKYYAQTITVVNEQMSFIKATHQKIDDIWKITCEQTIPKQVNEALDLLLVSTAVLGLAPVGSKGVRIEAKVTFDVSGNLSDPLLILDNSISTRTKSGIVKSPK